jgi:TonB family protein
MRSGTTLASWVGIVLASLGVHAVAFGGLGQRDWDADGLPRKQKPTTMEMTVSPPKPSIPPTADAPSPTPQKPRLAMARPAAKMHGAAAPAPTAEPRTAEAVADFTGQTLTNDGPGTGWSSATGNGQKMDGPIGRPGARISHRVVDGTPGGTGSGPPVVGLGDLSRAPVAPDLSHKLAAAYPAAARAQGIEGKAVVRARITPDGRVRDLAVISETTPGFGAACEVTLRASEWIPPIDQTGHAVSTIINYTCRFDVR